MAKIYKLILIILISFSSIRSINAFDFDEMFTSIKDLSSDLASCLTSATDDFLENRISADPIDYDISGIINLPSDVISSITTEVDNISSTIGEKLSEGGSKALDKGAYLYQAVKERATEGVDKVLLASKELKGIFSSIMELLASLKDITLDELSKRLDQIMDLVANYLGDNGDSTKFDLTKFLKVNSVEFLEGFLEGISRVGFGQNKCYQNIFAIKGSAAILKDLCDEEELSFGKLYKLYEQGGRLLRNYKSCHFEQVAKEVSSLSMIYGYGVITYRIVTNLKSVYGLFVNVKSMRESRDLGFNSGKFIGIVFDYYTE
jgi:hypothetical protein